MGAIGGLLGTAGGVAGTGIKGPQNTDIQQGVTTDQTGQAYGNVQQSFEDQQNLLKALGSQHALKKQQDIFNQGQNLADQLGRADIVGNQNQAIQGQQHLAQQYQDIAAGRGPNPAQAMLNQATGQNVANQAALMAGQRGAGANVGLMSRNAAYQGANTQQQAAGQAATMQANQQLSALGNVGAANQAAAGIAGQQLAAQQAQQGALAGQAGSMASQNIGATQAYNAAQQNQQANLLNALGAQNQARVGMQGNINSANAGMASTQMQGQQGLIGGVLGGAGSVAGLLKADGGMISHYADGGQATVQGPSGGFSAFLNTMSGAMGNSGLNPGAQQLQKGLTGFGAGIGGLMKKKPESGSYAGADMPAQVTPGAAGSALVPAPDTAMAAQGGLASGGGNVKAETPDQKAEKPGNSYDNDKIPAMLSEGEIVIPRDVLQSADPVGAASQFISETLNKRKMARGGVVHAYDGAGPLVAPQGATAPTDPESSTPAPEQPAADPNNPPVEVVGERTPQQIATDMNNRDLQYQQMLERGQVHPKTYSDLYAKNADGSDRSTLGKIGTLFGLMVSGAGAGLTHGPNMLMEMMNKQIDRDLDAQKTSTANTQNWYKLGLANELQNHQLAGMDANTATAVLSNDKARADYLRAFPEADLSASNTARNSATLSAVQSMQDTVNKMPPGPGRAQAQATVDQIKTQAFAQITNHNAQTAEKIASAKKKKGGGFSNGINEGLLSDSIIKGGSSQVKAPGLVMPGEVPTIQAEKSAVQANQDQWKQTSDVINDLAQMPFAGQAPGVANVGSAIGATGLAAGPIVGAATTALGHGIGRMTADAFETERQHRIGLLAKQTGLTEEQLDKVLPRWNDVQDPKKLQAAYDSAYKFFKDNEIKVSPNLRTLNKQHDGHLFQELPKYELKKIRREAAKAEEQGKPSQKAHLSDFNASGNE